MILEMVSRLSSVQEWRRDEAVEVACAESLRDLLHTDDDVAEVHRGYDVWRRLSMPLPNDPRIRRSNQLCVLLA